MRNTIVRAVSSPKLEDSVVAVIQGVKILSPVRGVFLTDTDQYIPRIMRYSLGAGERIDTAVRLARQHGFEYLIFTPSTPMFSFPKEVVACSHTS